MSENEEAIIKEIEEESKTDVEAIRYKYGKEIDQDALNIIIELNKSYGSNKFKVLELIAKLKDTGFDTETIKTILLENIKFCSKATKYRLLPKEFKQDYTKKSDKLSDPEKVSNENLNSQNINTSSSGQQTVQEPNPNPEPEPVYNQGQTITDESKLPDQGLMSDIEPLPEGKEWYDSDKRDHRDQAIETLQQELEKVRTELAQARLNSFNKEEFEKLKKESIEVNKEVDRLREELKQANQPKQTTDEIRYHFPLRAMYDVCDKHLKDGSVKAYIIVRNGKISGVRAILPDRR